MKKRSELPGLNHQTVLITGAARRLGREIALKIADAGADVIIHHGHSQSEAESTANEIRSKGRQAYIIAADLNDHQQAGELIHQANTLAPIDILINSAAIFEPVKFQNTNLDTWQRHLNINLTAPFLLSQMFANSLLPDRQGRIINILDWRALRPGYDHFPYTISKAALASMTKAMALALAPRIIVNGLALGAILPPADGESTDGLIKNVPLRRWAKLDEVGEAILFLLTGPEYITGEIIHVDGGRHLV
jgi:NAD(P)-dependent dehydrogenase (short-subunit alcohol dehydrogenase family)